MSSLYSPALRNEMDRASEEALSTSAEELADSALQQFHLFGGDAPARDTLVEEYRALLEDAG